MTSQRREFLIMAAALGLGGVDSLAASALGAQPKKPGAPIPRPAEPATPSSDEANSPPEDMMLEHAVLERLLLIYDEAVGRLRRGENLPAGVIRQAATIVRRHIHSYHELREESVIFPSFKGHADWATLLKTLQAQHAAGKALTEKILAGAEQNVADACAAFVRMYRPHMAREATELFPTLYEIVSTKALEDMSTRLLKIEQRTLGASGYEKIIEEIDTLEQQLGINDLDKFTPIGVA